MPRTRAKAPPRLTRDAERLIALANGLNASGSLTEDRFWESEMSALVARLLENGNDAPIDGALDHLYQTNLGAYDTLIELVENESESVVVMQGDRALAGAARRRAHRGVVEVRDSLGHHRARGSRHAARAAPGACARRRAPSVTLVPYLYSIDQLPRHFSELRRLAARLSDAAITGEVPRARARAPSGDRAPARRHALPDRLRRGAARASALPLAGGRLGTRGPRRQPRAVDRAGAAHARQGAARLRVRVPAARRLLRELPRVGPARAPVRAFARPSRFLENALKAKAADLQAVVAGFGEERVDEYRVAFSPRRRELRSPHGVVWPLYGREDETRAPARSTK